ncbi:TPA: HlyD family efflux transporter periplasmic adaptor subunit [Legionella pneumophila]|nr:HlyD family efflux transporter periplasmic adaptor subunit [Legionella pneumophila]MDW8880346.1 HlyD family efflux transporter periplasmic adaptor subunit [Legionella pneumophila subsp. fraseri]MDW8963260.1 HlyD family efflux transporter periplasmic adaptor subunit [Legionella pneumophila subsp. fraseri]MDW9036960.1 HlyD family efflux transporter periplasmic adaptor subunit [Legionella pneumophila subsp. fraseri]MDW9040107.1 HlyD family efflux transporter periplasmic adaptor subunit [Legione
MKLHAYTMISKLPKPQKIGKIIFTVFVIIILFLSFTPWQQFALGNGKVIAFSPTERQHTVNSPVSGRIKKWYVDEGMRVNPGDPIVDITDNDPELLSRLEVEKKAILLRIEAAKQAIVAGKANVDRQKKLYEQGINSRRQYELAQIEYAKYQNELAQANIDKVNVDVRIARQKTQIIKAHVAGIIFRRLTGQESVVVNAGDVLAQILPETESRAVELWIDGNDIPFVRLNQKARLQFEGWPAIQFRGWPEIAVGTFGGAVSFIDPTDNGFGLFRVVIVPNEPWPGTRFLRQGVRVHGWIQLGQVPLWYELWRQYNGFPPESDRENKAS